MAQTTIAGGFVDSDLVSAQTALTAGLVSTDELIISDAGVLKRMDISVLEDYIVTNLGDNNIDVTQSSHGFAVGDVIRVTTTNNTYAKALADTAANAEVIGIVIDVTDTNNFTYATSGEITVAAAVPNSTTAGDIVFLSTSSAGGTQTTEPSVADQISKPIAVITEANNKMILLPYRGEIISGGATSFAPVDATYLALSANGTLTGERVLTAGTGLTLTDAGAGGAATITIDNDSITFAKMQNVAANSVLVRNANSSGDLAELALATTQILIGNGTGFTAAALSGEATMTNAGVVSIADNIIDEANLKVSNGPTNGQVLTARSGNTGGMTWEAASAGATLTGSTNNTIVTVTGADAMAGETELTYTGGQLTINNDGGVAILNIDASSGQSQVKHINAGTTKWEVGIDGDGSGNQKSHVDDFAFYNGSYGVVISGNGSTKFGIGTQAGIALSSAEIPADGIQFPATAALSASANNLDDYQEGTFTPYLHDWSFDSSEATHTANRVGRYVKIGRFVYFWIYIGWSSIGTLATGSQGLVGGLPYTAMAGTNHNATVSIGHAYGLGLPSAADSPCATINANTAYISFHVWTLTAGASSMNFSQFGPNPTANFILSGFYETNS